MSDKLYRFEFFDATDYHRKFTGTLIAAEWEIEDAIGREFNIPDVVSGVLKAEHFTMLPRTDDFIQKMIAEYKTRSLMGMNPLPYIVEDEEYEEAV